MREYDEKQMSKVSDLAIMVAIIAVSFSAIFIRWSDAHPFVIATYRMGITSLILLPIILVKYIDDIRKINKNDFIIMVAIGIILAVHFGSWITSLEETSVASSVILVTSHPLFVAIIAHYVLKERLGKIGYVGIVIAFIGIVILSFGDYSISGQNFRGDVLALVGSIAAGLYILGGRRIRSNVTLVPYAFIVYSICTICLLASSLAVSAVIYPLPMREYQLFVLMAVIPTILGHTLYNFALKYVKAQVVSVSLLGEPIGASILALLLLSEAPPLFTIFGGALILPGIYLAYRGRDVEKGGERGAGRGDFKGERL